MTKDRTASRRPSPRARASTTICVAAAVALMATACGRNPTPSLSPSSAPSIPAVPSNVPASGEASGAPTTPSVQPVTEIEQPPLPSGIPVAPDTVRVDLGMPSFSNPTQVTNPLFPVSRQASVLMLGKVDDKPFRTEVTLLPFTRIVVWESQRVETVVSQYLAYLDGRIQEVAYDLYAQADDGSVWYFGEDVSDLEDGAIVTKEGTWLAGKDAPAAMIMPAEPEVGDVFRTENSPGFAFEEVTVKSVDQTVEGPLGPVTGGLVVSELHMDGATEDKTFAPGYGEFLTTGGGDVEALALAVPTDATSGAVPVELASLVAGAAATFAAGGSHDWKAASAGVKKMTAAWDRYRTVGVPKLIEPRMIAALKALGRAVAAHDVGTSRQAAIETARSSLDIQLRYRPAAEINLARFDLWAAQVLVDAAAKDASGVNGDAFTLVYIRDRILGSVDGADLGLLNGQILDLQVAATDHDFTAAARAAVQLREIVAGVQP
jgi:hypothetical protein